MEKQKKGIIEKIINALLNIFIFIFSIILLISVYNNIQVKVFGKDYSDFFGYSLFEVQTGSMTPEINPGDWIVVKSTKNIKLKDVITYKQDGEFITHRVIGTYNTTFVTKGDANNSKDDPIDKNQIVGKVVKILPNFGIFKKTIFNPVVIVAIIITILICNFIFKNKKKEKTKVENCTTKKIISKITKKINLIKEQQKEKNTIKLEKQKEQKTNEEKSVKEQIKEETKVIETNIENIEKEEFDDIPSLIPVDASELDETFLEIAQNEIEEEEKIVEKKQEVEYEEEIKQPTKLNLDLLETGRKSKNIIDKFISIKIEEINEIINLIDISDKAQVNEPTIKNKLLSSYLDSRYYNYYGNVDIANNKKQIIKIQKYLEETATLLKAKYKGTDSKYNEKVDKFLNIFSIISNLEHARDSITDRKAKEEYYKKELLKYSKTNSFDNTKMKNIILEIMKVQRNYVGIIEYLFKKLETNMFELEFNKLKTNKNTYCLSLQHNITFGKLYSDYIIDKTYNEGVIAENKAIITLNLLSISLVKDMINANFEKKYIIHIPKSLYSKAKKLERVLKIIEDEYAKESVIILMDLDSLIKYKTSVKKLKKEGYQISIALTSNTKIESKNDVIMNLVESIYVDKNIPNIVKTLSSLPEEIADKLVYENIIEKIGDFGGEE